MRFWESDVRKNLEACVEMTVRAIRSEPKTTVVPQRTVAEFFAGIGLHEEAVLLGGGEGTLNDETEVAVDLWEAIAEEGDAIAVEDGKGGGFDGLNVETGRLLPVETLKISDPPVLDGELRDLFHAVFADEIHAKATFEHEIIGCADLSLPE